VISVSQAPLFCSGSYCLLLIYCVGTARYWFEMMLLLYCGVCVCVCVCVCVFKLVSECVRYLFICKMHNGPHYLLQLHMHYACFKHSCLEIRIHSLWGLSYMSRPCSSSRHSYFPVRPSLHSRFCIHFNWLQHSSYPQVVILKRAFFFTTECWLEYQSAMWYLPWFSYGRGWHSLTHEMIQKNKKFKK